MSKPNDSVRLLAKIGDTLNTIGPKRFESGLDRMMTEGDFIDDICWNFIISQVCKYFKVKRVDLLYSRCKGGRTDALKVCYVLCVRHLDFTHQDLYRKFDKDPSVISKAIIAFNNMDAKIPHHRKVMSKYSTIEKSLKEFIEQGNNKQRA